jgi:hypothetical protein
MVSEVLEGKVVELWEQCKARSDRLSCGQNAAGYTSDGWP